MRLYSKRRNKKRHTTSGFTQAGVYSRKQFCADLEVYRPPELLCNLRLRQAAIPLSASGGQRSANTTENKIESEVQFDRFTIKQY